MAVYNRRLPNTIEDVKSVAGRVAANAYIALVYVMVLLPVGFAVAIGATGNVEFVLREAYVSSLLNSFKLGLAVAIITTPLATIAARFYRHVSYKTLYILFLALPLFIPGDIHALAIAVVAQQLDLSLSFWTLLTAHIFWAFPFAFLMILATMVNLPPNVVSAAQDLGANGLRSFFDVELPLIQDGIVSAFLLSFLISINETARANVLGGQFTTISGFIRSHYISVGLDQTVYTLSWMLVMFAITTIAVILFILLYR